MDLQPCSKCRRHVSVDERACPFCDALTMPIAARSTLLVGRLSRAAVFAGATLAGACYTNPPAQQSPPPPPPPDDTRQVQQQDAPPPPDGTFAKPPAGTSSIRGVVVDASGAPQMNVVVRLVGKVPEQTARTDANGNYAFANVEPGTYQLAVPDPANGGQQVRTVTVQAGAVVTTNVQLSPPDWRQNRGRDNGPCCKPYGAPPARRRVV